MYERFLQFINRLIKDDEKVLVAVSGGKDSMTLLDLFARYFSDNISRLEVAHLNHMIRGRDAEKDRDFVINYCKMIGIKSYHKDVDIPKLAKEKGLSIEDAGRQERYAFFNEIMSKDKYKLALGHNQNDQVETVLMRIIRGTGTDGLQGIKAVDGPIIRPLLIFSRQEIEDYHTSRKLSFTQDETNFENDYTRNKLRNILIPYIKENFNSNFESSILKLSEIATSEKELKESYIENLYEEIKVKENDIEIVFDITAINKLSSDVKIQLIRFMINKLKGHLYGFEYKHFEEFVNLLNKDSGKYQEINNIKLSLGQKQVSLRLSEPGNSIETLVRGSKSFFDYLVEIKENPLNIEINLRTRKNGDKVKIKGKYKKLKDFLIDKKIPSFERDFLPLLEIENNIIAVGNLYKNDEIIKKYNLKLLIKMED